MKELPIVGITEASQLTKTSILALAPARLSGVGKRGAKLGVKYRVSKSGDGAQSQINATGPFQLIERDTRAHSEPRKHRPRRYNAIPGEGVFSHVEHPGTKGKHPFERGVLAALPACLKFFDLSTSSVIRSLI